MRRTRGLIHKPSPAMIVAIIALIVAMTGTAVAAKKLGLGALNGKAKDKTVGVGKLYYATNSQTVTSALTTLSVTCPKGTKPIGGGVHPTNMATAYFVVDSYPTANGWTAHALTNANQTMITNVICAVSRKVIGSPG